MTVSASDSGSTENFCFVRVSCRRQSCSLRVLSMNQRKRASHGKFNYPAVSSSVLQMNARRGGQWIYAKCLPQIIRDIFVHANDPWETGLGNCPPRPGRPRPGSDPVIPYSAPHAGGPSHNTSTTYSYYGRDRIYVPYVTVYICDVSTKL